MGAATKPIRTPGFLSVYFGNIEPKIRGGPPSAGIFNKPRISRRG